MAATTGPASGPRHPLRALAVLAAVLAFVVAPALGCRGSTCCTGTATAAAAAGAALAADKTEKLVVVDTDAGADDAMAMLALLGAEAEQAASKDGTRGARVRVLAVTCVQGNTGVHNVTRNVLATLHTVGRLDVPVHRGAAQSLLYTPATDFFFGSDGFGDFLPASLGYGRVQAEHAALALVRLAARHPGRISLLCLGPLTNVALAARLDPSFLSNLKEIHVLGGSSTGVGNTKAATEFNVYIDAEAFQAVLSSVPKPIYWMPWETVQDANITATWHTDTLGKLDTPQVKFLMQAERLRVDKGDHYNPADSMVALYALRPDIITATLTTNVQVVLGDGFARAATLVDYVGKSGKAANAVLLQRPDRPLVECLLQELLSAPVLHPPRGPARLDWQADKAAA